MDEDGDTSDWLELHNYGTQDISIDNWFLSDDENDLSKWTFPNIILAADEYLLLWASAKDRSSVSYFRTLINQGEKYKYILPNSELNTTWKTIDFDDLSWSEGVSGFGYGDGDDATTIPNGTQSIYLRKKFTVNDLDNITSLILDMDYDDGFVAYINGVEIARANIYGMPPAYNSKTITALEAQIYSGDSPERFPIANFASILKEGENILTIQAHNIASNSSDFTVIPFLSAVFSVPNNSGIPAPKILGEIYFHTNFKISSSSETLILSDSAGTIIDQVIAENLPPDTSIGISKNSRKIVSYLETTPEYENSSNEYIGTVQSAVIFSEKGGLVEGPKSLILSGNNSEEIIRYTIGGNTPIETSSAYTGPIQIDDNTSIRAKIFLKDHIPSKEYTKTYIFNSNHKIDVVLLTTEASNLFNEDTGIYTFGPEGTYINQYPYRGANFWEEWERPIHFAFYENEGNTSVEFNGGVKIFGGWSRANKQKSLALFARGQYGDSEFKHSFFNALNYTNFEALVLRNSGNDNLRSSMKDIMLTSLMRGSGLDFQEHTPVATYINGYYWGMYNLREKTNEHMLASKHNINADDITLLGGNAQILEGSNQEYNQLIKYINETDLTADINFEYVKQEIDLQEYIIYQAAQIFFGNTDWLANNIKFWKHPQGKWRWIMYDTDFGFGYGEGWDHDTLNYALEENEPSRWNPLWSTLLFRKLITNIDFRNTFINRYADELNTRFLPDKVNAHIDQVYKTIEPEIEAHYTRWETNPSQNESYVNTLRIFANNRHAIAKSHIKTNFNLPAHHSIIITNPEVSRGFVEVNKNLNIQDSSWSGDYFETVPIQLTAVPKSGFKFSHWSGDVSSTENTINLSLINNMAVSPNFSLLINELPIVINEINYKSTDNFDAGDWVELYNPNAAVIDISNWQLKDDDDSNSYTIPSGTSIDAKGYIVIVKDGSDFSTVYPEITNYIGDIDFGFGTSDAVRLFNSSNELQDEVIYLSEAPWSDCADETGNTLELISPDLDNALPENWNCINENGSPNAINSSSTAIVINEINYKSTDNFDAGDWVELYNPNAAVIDISNWQLKDDDDSNSYTIPSGTSIDAKGYIVIVKDGSDFSTVYPEITNYIGDIDFGFGTSDAVRLFNSSNELQDEVIYLSEAPWSDCADETGNTLELISPDLDNALPENWNCINENGSPNAINSSTLLIEKLPIIAIKIYPNPVENILHISGILNPIKVRVYNLLGQEIFNIKNHGNKVDLSNLYRGMYLIKISNSETNTLLKFIKN